MYEVLAVSAMPAPSDVENCDGNVRLSSTSYEAELFQPTRRESAWNRHGTLCRVDTENAAALKTFANSQKRPMEYLLSLTPPFFNGPTSITCLDIRPTTSGSRKGGSKMNASEE